MYVWTRSRVAGIHFEPSVNLVISLCLGFRSLTILYGERDVLVLADDKLGGTEERLLGGVENDDGVSSSESSVNVDMDLVGVECVLEADEPQNVTEELVDEGVGSPGSELWPNSS